MPRDPKPRIPVTPAGLLWVTALAAIISCHAVTAAEPPVASAAATVTAPAPVQEDTTQIGGATHNLLSLQRSGSVAAPPRALAGDEATLAYRRYLESYRHPIPIFFNTSVGSAGGGSGSSAGSGAGASAGSH